MSALARLLIARGIRVSGSDAKDSRRVDALRALGAECHIGHDQGNVGDVGAVVVSTAIAPTNVEVVAARERGIPIVHRSDALAMTTLGKDVLAVAGTHGKTTTTSMLTVILQACGVDPSFAIGSELHDSGSNAHLGTGDAFVVEADESDGSFLRLDARVGIVTNMEADHLNYWGTAEAMEAGFYDFGAAIGARGGYLVVCRDDPGAARLGVTLAAAGVDVRTYGVDPDSDYRITVERSTAEGSDFFVEGPSLGVSAHVGVPGLHNVRNATAAMVVAAGLELPAEEIARGLGSSPVPVGASSTGARSPGCGSSMTMRTTRPRSRPLCGRLVMWWGPGTSGWRSKPITTTARRCTCKSSGRRSAWRTSWWSWRCSRPAKCRFPGPAAREWLTRSRCPRVRWCSNPRGRRWPHTWRTELEPATS